MLFRSLVVNTLVEKRIESVTGLVLILAGLPLFFWFRSRPASPLPRTGERVG